MKRNRFFLVGLLSLLLMLLTACPNTDSTSDNTSDNTENLYTIVFDSRGGKEFDPIKTDKDSLVSLPVPTRDDAQFEGWYTSTDWDNKIGQTVFFEKNTVLYARWITLQRKDLTLGNYTSFFQITFTLSSVLHKTIGQNTSLDCQYKITVAILDDNIKSCRFSISLITTDNTIYPTIAVVELRSFLWLGSKLVVSNNHRLDDILISGAWRTTGGYPKDPPNPPSFTLSSSSWVEINLPEEPI